MPRRRLCHPLERLANAKVCSSEYYEIELARGLSISLAFSVERSWENLSQNLSRVADLTQQILK